MGLLKGSISYTRFYVRGEVPGDAVARFLAAIRLRAFRPLVAEAEEDESYGWVTVDRPYDVESRFDPEVVFLNQYVNLALRIDRWRFPAAVVKTKMREAERAYRERTGKSRVSKAEKVELRAAVERRLRQDGVPTTKVVDLSWNLHTATLRFWSGSARTHEYLYELFEKTFGPGLELTPASPYTIGTMFPHPFGLEDVQRERLDRIGPASFRSAASPPAEPRTERSLIEKIEGARFLGREFLTWVWFESELFESKFDIRGGGDRELWLEKSITLDSVPGAGGKESSRLTGTAPSTRLEAKEALRQGKLPTNAKMGIVRGKEHTFALTLGADALALSGVKIPALLKDAGDDPFYERIALIEELESVIDTLFRQFLELRLDSAWPTTVLPAIRAWVRINEGDEEPRPIAAYCKKYARSVEAAVA